MVLGVKLLLPVADHLHAGGEKFLRLLVGVDLVRIGGIDVLEPEFVAMLDAIAPGEMDDLLVLVFHEVEAGRYTGSQVSR